MIAEILYTRSAPKRLDTDWYCSLFSRFLYHAVVLSKPASSGVFADHLMRSRALDGFAYHSEVSHSRLSIVNRGSSAMLNSTFARFAISAIVVLTPVPILNDSP